MVDVPRIKHGDRQTIDTLISEEAETWDKAEDCRRMSKIKCDAPANVNIGKVGATSMDCPHWVHLNLLPQNQTKSHANIVERTKYSLKVLDLP